VRSALQISSREAERQDQLDRERKKWWIVELDGIERWIVGLDGIERSHVDGGLVNKFGRRNPVSLGPNCPKVILPEEWQNALAACEQSKHEPEKSIFQLQELKRRGLDLAAKLDVPTVERGRNVRGRRGWLLRHTVRSYWRNPTLIRFLLDEGCDYYWSGPFTATEVSSFGGNHFGEVQYANIQTYMRRLIADIELRRAQAERIGLLSPDGKERYLEHLDVTLQSYREIADMLDEHYDTHYRDIENNRMLMALEILNLGGKLCPSNHPYRRRQHQGLRRQKGMLCDKMTEFLGTEWTRLRSFD